MARTIVRQAEEMPTPELPTLYVHLGPTALF